MGVNFAAINRIINPLKSVLMTLEECLAVDGLSLKEKGTIKATFGRKNPNKFSACADAAALNELLAKNREKANEKEAIEEAVADAKKNGATTEDIVKAITNIYKEKRVAELEAELAKLKAN